MVTHLVTYYGNSSNWFDRAYYVNKHIPHALEIGAPLGLLSMQAFFPEGPEGGLVALAVLHFRDENAIQSFFASPRLRELNEDCAKYTDIRPQENVVTLWQAN
jgi:uncharacterized protein (TIGR02118 family)